MHYSVCIVQHIVCDMLYSIRLLIFCLNWHKCRLEIKQVGEGGHHVPGLVEARVKNVSEVWDVLRTGSNGRAVGSTNANEHSSRSHWFVFLCTLFHCMSLSRR